MHVRATYLAILQTLFLGRVLGQIVAELAAPPWLPSVEHWQSGLLPYPLLLAAQILILMFMSLVTYDAVRRDGLWHVQKQKTKKILRCIAYGYMAAMVLRYILTMALLPDLRWFGHTIPITFHFVLASYILILGLPAERPMRRAAITAPHTAERSAQRS
jgi:hypothetical protein